MKHINTTVLIAMAGMTLTSLGLTPGVAAPSQSPTLTQLRAAKKVLEARIQLSRKRDIYTDAVPYVADRKRQIALYSKATTPQALALAGKQMQPALESEKADLELRIIEMRETHTEQSPAISNAHARLGEIRRELQILKTAGSSPRQAGQHTKR